MVAKQAMVMAVLVTQSTVEQSSWQAVKQSSSGSLTGNGNGRNGKAVEQSSSQAAK